MKHYSKEELECYRNHGMSVLGRIRCATHLKECTQCAALLAELGQEDQFVEELKESLHSYEEAGKVIPVTGLTRGE